MGADRASRNFLSYLESDGHRGDGRNRFAAQDSIDSDLVAFGLLLAHAQADRKNVLGLLLGATVAPALQTVEPTGGNVEIGSGITFQLNYARHLSTSRSVALYFEIPALAVPLQNISAPNGAVPRNCDSFFVTPALRIKLVPHASVSPWLSAGGGYALFDESAKRIDGTHNTTRGTSGNEAQTVAYLVDRAAARI